MSSTRSSTFSARLKMRLNLWLTAFLLVGLLAVGNDLARQHMPRRKDLSEDQLYALSEASARILGSLEDRLQVTTFFTGHMESGQMALAKAHVQGQLQELQALAEEHMEVVDLDPSISSQAATRAEQLGIQPITQESLQGTQVVRQAVFFGLQLQYRGREQVLDFVDPRSFEVQFASAVYSLVRDRRARIGWLGDWERKLDNATTATRSSYVTARALLERRHVLEDVTGLEFGDAISSDLDLVFVVRPTRLHPRAAFELDQYVQRGGRLVICVDQADYSWLGLDRAGSDRGAEVQLTGLDALLTAWGALPTPQHVWDPLWAAQQGWLRPQAPDPETGKPRATREVCEHPLLVEVHEEGLDPTHPVATGLQRPVLSWAQPIAPLDPPQGVTRLALLRSSERAHRTEIGDRHVTDQEQIDSRSVIEAASGSGRAYDLAVVLSGALPSPFEGAAPASYDVLLDADPTTTERTTDEDVLSRSSDARVVVMGDADWMRDAGNYELYPFIGRRENQLLLMNLVDWLTQGEDLIDLRRRVPQHRDLVDFEAVALEEMGLTQLPAASNQAELDRRLALAEEARSRGRSDEARAMWIPILLTLALVLGFGLAWNFGRRGGRDT